MLSIGNDLENGIKRDEPLPLVAKIYALYLLPVALLTHES